MVYLSDLEVGDFVQHQFNGMLREGFIESISANTVVYGPPGDAFWLFNDGDASNIKVFKREEFPEYYL